MIGGRHLYIMQMAVTGAVKIGRSSDVKRRLGEIQTGCPYKVKIILVLKDQGFLERNLHDRLHKHRTRRFAGEWFDYVGLPCLPDGFYEQLDLDHVDQWWRD